MNDETIDQLSDIRDTGEMNMMDPDVVQTAAENRGFKELAAFIEENDTAEYAKALAKLAE